MASNWMDDIRHLIVALAEKENLQVVARNALLGTGIGLTSAGVGLFIGGPFGVVAGAAVGGLALAVMNGGYRPLADYLQELGAELKEKLYDGVMKLLNGINWQRLDNLLEIVLENPKLKKKIIDFISKFFEPMHMAVVPR